MSSRHRFVVYGDCCSGIPGALHEETAASVNRVVAALQPPPDFVCFLGDEVMGLTTSEDNLRAQWRYWLNHEMAWLDRTVTPLYNVPANHTAYDVMSERVYADVMTHLPANGPAGQERLSYFVRRGDLLMIFVNTMSTALGEGRVETDWLEETLRQHADARHKLVFGHHPVWPVNGFSGEYQRELEYVNGQRFWGVLRRHGVLAYFCSHMLALDVQVRDGILQILTAGAGAAHLMPPEWEYLHAVSVDLDETGLRHEVLDTDGAVRERLSWPPLEPAPDAWIEIAAGAPHLSPRFAEAPVWLEVSGITTPSPSWSQTILCAWNDDAWLPPLWLGLVGPEQRLSVLLAPQVGRSPHLWTGPAMPAGAPFHLHLLLHPGLGPGGLLWRAGPGAPWTSLTCASAWGLQRLPATTHMSVGCGKGNADRPWQGPELRVEIAVLPVHRGERTGRSHAWPATSQPRITPPRARPAGVPGSR